MLKYAALDAYSALMIYLETKKGPPASPFSRPIDVTHSGPRVLLDPFHAMERITKLIPMHHSFRNAFLFKLRDAIFIQKQGDIDNLNAVLERRSPPSTAFEILATRPDWYLSRVRRIIPEPKILRERIVACMEAFDCSIFKDEEGVPIISSKVKDQFLHLLKHVDAGCLSDPKGLRLYYKVRDDREGLSVYRCIRGTNTVERFHQFLEMSFEPWNAGPRYTHCALTLLINRYNINSSELYRPGFPRVGHYAHFILDSIQTATSHIFGQPTYRWWRSSNSKEKFTGETFVLTPVVEPEEYETFTENNLKHYSPSLRYLAVRMRQKVPHLPIIFDQEKKLYFEHAQQYRNRTGMNFAQFALDWNAGLLINRDGVNRAINAKPSYEGRIFKKTACHLSSFYTRYERLVQRCGAKKAANHELVSLAQKLEQLSADIFHEEYAVSVPLVIPEIEENVLAAQEHAQEPAGLWHGDQILQVAIGSGLVVYCKAR